MARHQDVKVGDTNWVIRHGGGDQPVEVVAKSRNDKGKWEFKLRRIDAGGNVVSNRTLKRGAGSLRPAGSPAPSRTLTPAQVAAGFGGNPSRLGPTPGKAKRPAKKRAARPAKTAARPSSASPRRRRPGSSPRRAVHRTKRTFVSKPLQPRSCCGEIASTRRCGARV